jgi:DNA repair exonuclease SbcCD nuclease subunit
MILLADLHAGLYQDNSIWHDVCVELAREIGDVCIKTNNDVIAVLGDIFDNKKMMNQKTQDVMWHIITDIWKEFHIILVRGNHDTYYKDQPQPNWLTMYRECNNVVTVEEKPYLLVDKCFVPWGYDISQLDWGGYLLGHFEINGALMNNSYECRSANVSLSDFKKFKKVYAGHFHFPQTYGNVTYLGSPFQHNFGDVGNRRGYYIWDNGNLNFVEFTKAPKFVIIKTSDEISPDNVRGNIVKLIFDRDYGTARNNELVEKIEIMEPTSLTTNISNFNLTEENQDNAESEELLVIKNNKDLLKEYMDKKVDLLPHLQRKTLYKVLDLMVNGLEEEKE